MLVAAAHAQQLYVGSWVDPYSPDGFSMNGAFNNWAAYSQVAGSTFITPYVRKGVDIRDYAGYGKFAENEERLEREGHEVMVDAATARNAMLYPTNLNPDKDNALSQYGSEQYALVADLKDIGGLQPYTFYEGGDHGIYYFTDVDDGACIWYSMNWSHPNSW